MNANTRYFYDCPLKATYMAKYFGFNFETSIVDKSLDILDQIDSVQKFYLHPDSLHLLEAQVGDVFFNKESNGVALISVLAKAMLTSENEEIMKAKNDIKIIQRNGVAFIWPEIE